DAFWSSWNTQRIGFHRQPGVRSGTSAPQYSRIGPIGRLIAFTFQKPAHLLMLPDEGKTVRDAHDKQPVFDTLASLFDQKRIPAIPVFLGLSRGFSQPFADPKRGPIFRFKNPPVYSIEIPNIIRATHISVPSEGRKNRFRKFDDIVFPPVTFSP